MRDDSSSRKGRGWTRNNNPYFMCACVIICLLRLIGAHHIDFVAGERSVACVSKYRPCIYIHV